MRLLELLGLRMGPSEWNRRNKRRKASIPVVIQEEAAGPGKEKQQTSGEVENSIADVESRRGLFSSETRKQSIKAKLC